MKEGFLFPSFHAINGHSIFPQENNLQIVPFFKRGNRFEIFRKRVFFQNVVTLICFFKGGLYKAFKLLHIEGAAVCRSDDDAVFCSDGDRFLQQVFIIFRRAERPFFCAGERRRIKDDEVKLQPFFSA